MEVSGTVLREVTCTSFSRHVPARGVAPGGGGGCVRVSVRPRTTVVIGCCSGFSDEGHLQYYKDKKKKGTAVLSTKKKLKMLKGLSKGLSLFPEFGFALDPEKSALLDDLQGNLTSDAAEVLMKQLEQLRAEEKELKRKRKQEKKAKLKASKSKMITAPDCESSSSSSESSESDCDDEAVDMKNMRVGVAVADAPSTAVDELQSPSPKAIMLSPPALLPKTVENPPEDASAHHHHHHAMELCSRNDDTSVSSISGGIKNESAVVTTAPLQKRIEVCMGNKCKRSGAAALLQEFERVVGVEGSAAVVGCKCMGKCKSGPNVRIQHSADSLAEGLNDSVKVPANPLFIGVALEDVETIVARFLGENHEDI